jgi:nucleotide-binding universal stress UspA family protein
VRILVPLDGSTYCQAATSVALQLGKAIDGSVLEGLHVVNVRTASGNLLADLTGYVGFEPAIVADDVYGAHTAAADAMVKAFVARAATLGVMATPRVETGAVAARIVEASLHADLVVMGQRGESDDRFPGQGGAQANNALPLLNAPALLVPRAVTRVRAFAVGYDGSASAAHGLKLVKRLAIPLQVPVHLVYVGTAAAGVPLLEQAATELTDACIVEKHFVTGSPVHQALARTAAEVGADVLVLGFTGKSKLRDVVFGSARDHLLGSARVGLLLAH